MQNPIVHVGRHHKHVRYTSEAVAAAERNRRTEIETATRGRYSSDEGIIEELNDISEQGKRMKEKVERLKKKKRSLQASIERIPSQETRARITYAGYDFGLLGNTSRTATTQTTTTSQTSSSPATDNCVICCTLPSSQAIIPCGHRCLCDDCATTLTGKCPLCRTSIQSFLKIFPSTG